MPSGGDDDNRRAEDLLKIAALDRVADDIAKEQRGMSALSFHPKWMTQRISRSA